MYDIYSTLNGKPSAAITVKQSYGSNASDVIKNVKALMADLEKNTFPKGMHYEISYDVSRFLDASMEKSYTYFIRSIYTGCNCCIPFPWRLAFNTDSGTCGSGFACRNICRNVGLWYYTKHDFLLPL